MHGCKPIFFGLYIRNEYLVLGFALACSEMNELFVDMAVTLYFLQQSRQD
jgi:hypothetical protein